MKLLAQYRVAQHQDGFWGASTAVTGDVEESTLVLPRRQMFDLFHLLV